MIAFSVKFYNKICYNKYHAPPPPPQPSPLTLYMHNCSRTTTCASRMLCCCVVCLYGSCQLHLVESLSSAGYNW